MQCNVFGCCSVVREVELSHVGANSVAVCKPSVVFNRRYKNKDGEWNEDKCFVTLEIWGVAAEKFKDRVGVGDSVFVSGYLLLNQWEGENGKKMSKHSIRVDEFHVLERLGNDNGHSTRDTSQQAKKPYVKKDPVKQTAKSTVATRAPVKAAVKNDDYVEDPGDDQIPF